MPEGLDKLAGGIGKAIETVPDLYDDALKPATQESGQTLALIPRAINAALVPLRQWIAEREYKLTETEKLLAKKLEHVGEEKIVTPEAYVAVPAIQAISYSMDSEELRNLYANLLAKAMNSDTKDMVHPSFVEIIKQLSPIDSLVFKTIMERETNPLMDLIYVKMGGETITYPVTNRSIYTNLSDINVATPDIICISLDNLTKQGLISIPNDKGYAEDKIYENILNSQFYLKMKKDHPKTSDGFEFSHTKKVIDKTKLGIAFYNICIINL